MNLATLPLLVCLGASALSGTAQNRDAPVTPTTGTATLSGTVFDDQDPARPVRRAIVTLTGTGLVPSRGAVTDDNGRFTLMNLPAGRFTLTVTRASYVTSVYGAKRPGRPGTAVEVKEGTVIRDLVVRIWRGAVLSGVIRDETGAPAQGIPVAAVPMREVTGQTILTLSNNGATTNERGEFRIFGLEPGTYVVSAAPTSGAGDAITTMTDAQVDAAFEALRKRGSAPTTAKPAPVILSASAPIDFAPVYYPGTAMLEQADPIVLTAGQERPNLDFALQRVPTAVVEGTVFRQDGSPAAGATLQLRIAVDQGAFLSGEPRQFSATSGTDGRFRLTRVTPGTYRLVARASVGGGGPPVPGPATAGSLWASHPITVTGSDLSGIAITVEPGVTVSGRIRFERTSATSPTPVPNLASLRVSVLTPSLARMKPNTPITQLGFGSSAAVLADGTFAVSGLLPDVYRFNVAFVPPGWVPRRAMLGDRDLFDGPADISGARDATVDVVFTDNASELSGRLVTPSGAAISDVFIIAFAADRSQWGRETRRVQAVRPDNNGRFVFTGLPPGEYLLGAVTDIDQGEWQDVAFLERLAAVSAKVSIAEGEKKTQDIRIGR
jgi:hypothetical protein